MELLLMGDNIGQNQIRTYCFCDMRAQHMRIV